MFCCGGALEAQRADTRAAANKTNKRFNFARAACAVIRGEHQAAFVAALEHAVAAVHRPRFFGGKVVLK